MNLSKNMDRNMNGIMKEILDLYQSGKDRMIFFAKSKSIGRQRQLDIGEKKYLRNLYSLPSVRNPASILHTCTQSDAFYLSQILSLIELPYSVWPDGIDTDEIKVGNNADRKSVV